jgi:hypothetical protein
MRRVVGAVACVLLVGCGSVSRLATAPSAYVPWAPLPARHADIEPPAQGAPPAIPLGTPPCQPSQLQGILIGRYSAMSNPDAPVVLRNTGSSACFLNGFPDLTIADSSGRVIASVAGSDGMGTYFDSGPTYVAVLMKTNTAPLESAIGWGGGQGLQPGQAFFNVEWAGCTVRPASTLYLSLRSGPGRLSIPWNVVPNSPDVCNRDRPLTRGPFDPTGISWSPDRHLLNVGMTLSIPDRSVARGSTLEYFVTLRNAGREDYPLDPCPDYWESVIAIKSSAFYALNCAPVETIHAGDSRTFEMEFPVSFDTPVGPTALLWDLPDPRIISRESAEAPITIT